MTLKHISFLQSSVMRNFERVAVDKGLVKPETLKKEASDRTIAQTEDLHGDMLKLASELRAKGYIEQASSLEDKVFLYKQAELHLYKVFDTDGDDLLDFAHPEDVKISDSQDDYGMVETPQSAHQKMVDVVKKNPNGKLASGLIDDIIKTAALALGQESFLVKTADGERVGTTTLEHVRSEDGSNEESFEDHFSEEYVARTGKIKAINAYVEAAWPKIAKMANEVSGTIGVNSPDSIYKFSSDYILKKNDAYNDLYCAYAEINKDVLDSFIIKNKETFGDAKPSVEIILEKIKSLGANPEEGGSVLKSFADKISKGLGNTYFSGVINPDEKNKFNNPNSIWAVGTLYGYNLVDKNVNAAANAIYGKFMEQYQAVINTELIEKASVGLSSEIRGLISGIGEVAKYFSDPFELEPNAKTVSNHLGDLNSQLNILAQLSPKSKVGARLRGLIRPMGANIVAFDNALELTTQTILDAVNFLSKNHLSEGDALVMDVDSAYNSFYQSAKLWADLMKDYSKDSKDYDNFRSNGAESFKLSEVVGAGKGKPFVQIMSEIKAEGISGFSAKNWEEFTAEAKKWLADSTKMVEAARPMGPPKAETQSADDGVIKAAELKGSNAPVPAKAAPTSGTTSAKPVGQGISAAETQQVKLMQDALNSLGVFLEPTGKYDRAELMKLRNTGQGPNTTSGDGNWGPRTTTAIETANKLFSLNLVYKRNPATATNDAKNNYAVLQKFVSTLDPTGKAKASSRMLDALPRDIDWKGAPESASMVNPDVKLYEVNLDTLSSLYDFLTKNRMAQPVTQGASDTEIGKEGFSLNQWSDILMWFRKRAVFEYNVSAKDPSLEAARNTAKKYFEKVSGLFSQYSAMIKNLGPSLQNLGTDTGKFVVPGEYLKQLATSPGGLDGISGGIGQENGAGSGSKMKHGPGKGSGGNIQEGYSLDLGQEENITPPIGPVLDLTRSEYFSISTQGLAYPKLPLEQFKKYPAVRMAQMFFGSGTGKPSEAEQRQVLTNAGLGRNVQWDKELGEYQINLSNKGMMPVSKALKDPRFANQYGNVIAGMYDIRERDPVNKFQNFLYALLNDIQKAANIWSSQDGITEREIEASQNYSNKWVQVINQKLEQIAQWREGPRGY